MLAVASCASSPGYPVRYDEYLAGIGDGLRAAEMEAPPRVEITWHRGNRFLGTCRLVDGEPVIRINVADILDQSDSVMDARDLIARVAEHEARHAALTCSDRDHARIR